MTTRRTGLALVAAGAVVGAGWLIADDLRHPTRDELAQRACLAEVARTAHQADDAGALAAQAADCSTDTL